MSEKRAAWRAAAPFLFLIGSIAWQAALADTAAPRIGDPPEAENMRLVGHEPLQMRAAYQPTIHHQGNKWIAYIGHMGGTDDVPSPVNSMSGQAEPNGTSIVDVTDPAHPRYLAHIPGQPGTYEGGGAQMTRVCDGSQLPRADRNAVYLLRAVGGQGHEIWDVREPEHPSLVTRIGQNLRDTHKSFWECGTGIAYLVSGVPGWRVRRMTEIYVIPPIQLKFVTSDCPGRNPVPRARFPPSCMGRSQPVQKATACTLDTARIQAASSRLLTEISSYTDRLRRRVKISCFPNSAVF
jgi:hypothetical protein